MTVPHAQTRYRAATMELVAYLDEHRVEMHIVTDTGETVAVACAKDSIFRVQRSIERMGQECPEIATWGDGPLHGPIELILPRKRLPRATARAAKHRLGPGTTTRQGIEGAAVS